MQIGFGVGAKKFERQGRGVILDGFAVTAQFLPRGIARTGQDGNGLPNVRNPARHAGYLTDHDPQRHRNRFSRAFGQQTSSVFFGILQVWLTGRQRQSNFFPVKGNEPGLLRRRKNRFRRIGRLMDLIGRWNATFCKKRFAQIFYDAVAALSDRCNILKKHGLRVVRITTSLTGARLFRSASRGALTWQRN